MRYDVNSLIKEDYSKMKDNLETLGREELAGLLLQEEARNAELSAKARAADERSIKIVSFLPTIFIVKGGRG